MNASFYTDIPSVPGIDWTSRKQVMAFEVWVKNYTQACLPVSNISPHWLGRWPEVPTTCGSDIVSRRLCVDWKYVTWKINILNHSSGVLESAHSGSREPTTCVSSQIYVHITLIAWNQLLVPWNHQILQIRAFSPFRKWLLNLDCAPASSTFIHYHSVTDGLMLLPRKEVQFGPEHGKQRRSWGRAEVNQYGRCAQREGRIIASCSGAARRYWGPWGGMSRMPTSRFCQRFALWISSSK